MLLVGRMLVVVVLASVQWWLLVLLMVRPHVVEVLLLHHYLMVAHHLFAVLLLYVSILRLIHWRQCHWWTWQRWMTLLLVVVGNHERSHLLCLRHCRTLWRIGQM